MSIHLIPEPQIHEVTIIVRNFNVLLPIMERTTRPKLSGKQKNKKQTSVKIQETLTTLLN